MSNSIILLKTDPEGYIPYFPALLEMYDLKRAIISGTEQCISNLCDTKNIFDTSRHKTIH